MLTFCAVALAGPTLVAAPVPRIEQQRIVAVFRRTWLPGFLPHGYIFSRWQSQPGSASAYGERLIVDFGHHGALLEWVVESRDDPMSVSHYDCKLKQAPANGGRIFRLRGRRIIYASGAKGADATLCLSHVAVVAWTPSLPPLTLARFVASAHRVG